MLNLSLRDRDRLVVLRELQEGVLKPSEAARRLGLTDRHVRRLRHRFREEGDKAVIHRARGRPSNNRIDECIRARALARASEPDFYDFGPTLLAEHLSRDPEIGPLNGPTLRCWLIAEGRWTVKSRGQRPRKAALGGMIQLDGRAPRKPHRPCRGLRLGLPPSLTFLVRGWVEWACPKTRQALLSRLNEPSLRTQPSDNLSVGGRNRTSAICQVSRKCPMGG